MNYQEKVETKLYELRHQAKTLFKVEIGNYEIKYDLTTQSALGMVKTKGDKVTLRLNSVLLEENAELYIDEVVVHEYAHLIVKARFPDGYNGHRRVQAHGVEFKAVCRAFGIEGKSTTKAFMNSEALKNASVTVAKKKGKKVHYYKCSCPFPKEFTTRRHNQVIRGASYSCGLCHTSLTYLKSAS